MTFPSSYSKVPEISDRALFTRLVLRMSWMSDRENSVVAELT